jgi:hypothetical protein
MASTILESICFSLFVEAAVYRTTKLRRGMEASRLSSCKITTIHYGRTSAQVLHEQHRPAVGRHYGPIGLGNIRPTTVIGHAIRGTAQLALRYSIIPATNAGQYRSSELEDYWPGGDRMEQRVDNALARVHSGKRTTQLRDVSPMRWTRRPRYTEATVARAHG